MDDLNIDKEIYNKNSLMLLNIRDLRDIGRTFGVPSPTTKSKDELIDYILRIIYGEVKGEERTTRGRPTSRVFDMDKYVTEIKKRSIVKPSMFMYPEGFSDYSFTLAAPKSEYKKSLEILQRVFVIDEGMGYLREHGFVQSDNDLKVQKEISQKFNLQNFDMVEIIKYGSIFKIVSVNGKNIENNLEEFDVGDITLYNGGRQVFHCRTKEEIQQNINQVINNCQNKNIKCLIFADAEKYNFSGEVVAYSEADDSSKIYNKLMQFISQAEKYIYNNEPVVAIICETQTLSKVINSFDEEVAERTKKHLLEKEDLCTSLGNVLLIYSLDKTEIFY